MVQLGQRAGFAGEALGKAGIAPGRCGGRIFSATRRSRPAGGPCRPRPCRRGRCNSRISSWGNSLRDSSATGGRDEAGVSRPPCAGACGGAEAGLHQALRAKALGRIRRPAALPQLGQIAFVSITISVHLSSAGKVTGDQMEVETVRNMMTSCVAILRLRAECFTSAANAQHEQGGAIPPPPPRARRRCGRSPPAAVRGSAGAAGAPPLHRAFVHAQLARPARRRAALRRLRPGTASARRTAPPCLPLIFLLAGAISTSFQQRQGPAPFEALLRRQRSAGSRP